MKILYLISLTCLLSTPLAFSQNRSSPDADTDTFIISSPPGATATPPSETAVDRSAREESPFPVIFITTSPDQIRTSGGDVPEFERIRLLATMSEISNNLLGSDRMIFSVWRENLLRGDEEIMDIENFCNSNDLLSSSVTASTMAIGRKAIEDNLEQRTLISFQNMVRNLSDSGQQIINNRMERIRGAGGAISSVRTDWDWLSQHNPEQVIMLTEKMCSRVQLLRQ